VLSDNLHTQADSHNPHAGPVTRNFINQSAEKVHSLSHYQYRLYLASQGEAYDVSHSAVTGGGGGWGISLFSVHSNFNPNTPRHAIPVSLNLAAVSRLTNDGDYSYK
jgi:predicted heme/steroid binding protein